MKYSRTHILSVKACCIRVISRGTAWTLTRSSQRNLRTSARICPSIASSMGRCGIGSQRSEESRSTTGCVRGELARADEGARDSPRPLQVPIQNAYTLFGFGANLRVEIRKNITGSAESLKEYNNDRH